MLQLISRLNGDIRSPGWWLSPELAIRTHHTIINTPHQAIFFDQGCFSKHDLLLIGNDARLTLSFRSQRLTAYCARLYCHPRSVSDAFHLPCCWERLRIQYPTMF